MQFIGSQRVRHDYMTEQHQQVMVFISYSDFFFFLILSILLMVSMAEDVSIVSLFKISVLFSLIFSTPPFFFLILFYF